MRKVLALVAPPVGIIVLAVVVVVLAIPTEDPVKQGTLGAAIVGAGGFLLNYVRAAQKEDDERRKKEERLTVRPVVAVHSGGSLPNLDDGERLGVEIYNEGPLVNIRFVGAVATLDGSEHAEQMILWESNPSQTVTAMPIERKQCILDHKQAVAFTLPIHSRMRNVHLLNEKSNPLEIHVQTYSGTVYKIGGKEIREAIVRFNTHRSSP